MKTSDAIAWHDKPLQQGECNWVSPLQCSNEVRLHMIIVCMIHINMPSPSGWVELSISLAVLVWYWILAWYWIQGWSLMAIKSRVMIWWIPCMHAYFAFTVHTRAWSVIWSARHLHYLSVSCICRYDVKIISGDQDLFQLVDDLRHISILYPNCEFG